MEETLAEKISRELGQRKVAHTVGVEDELMQLGGGLAGRRRRQVEEEMETSGRLLMRGDIEGGPLGQKRSRAELELDRVGKNEEMEEFDDEEEDEDDDEEEEDEEEVEDEEHEEPVSHLKLVSDRLESDKRKAAGVVVQSKVWQRALGLRVRMQKALLVAERVPCFDRRQGLSAEMFQGASQLRGLLGDVHGLLQQLRGEEEPRELPAGLEETWAAVHACNERARGAEEELLDEWNERVELTRGVMGRNSKANRSTVKQVRHALEHDRERLLKRARTNRTGVLPLGGGSDAERYDDMDFYHHVLKSFIEAKTGAAPTGAQMAMERNSRPQSRVDRRASKGRKIRYNAVDKLVHFTTPAANFELEPVHEALFSTLFQ